MRGKKKKIGRLMPDQMYCFAGLCYAKFLFLKEVGTDEFSFQAPNVAAM